MPCRHASHDLVAAADAAVVLWRSAARADAPQQYQLLHLADAIFTLEARTPGPSNPRVPPMTSIVHQAYIISDLHLGGRFPCGEDRGFRMMDRPDVLAEFIRLLAARPPTAPTLELIINGDFLDFLAEADADGTWKAFRDQPGAAVAVFRMIADRPEDGAVFDALAGFLDRGHRLTILLGNHDIELAWPEVRAAFEKRLSTRKQTPAFNLRWLYDGEALIVGDALIEHGNRYDPANFVDHQRLRRVRELRSRRLHAREGDIFYPPMGSRLVAEIMNPIKKDYPFIDLLKPESEPLIALLLTLDPSKRGHLGALARLDPEAAAQRDRYARRPRLPPADRRAAEARRASRAPRIAARGPGRGRRLPSSRPSSPSCIHSGAGCRGTRSGRGDLRQEGADGASSDEGISRAPVSSLGRTSQVGVDPDQAAVHEARPRVRDPAAPAAPGSAGAARRPNLRRHRRDRQALPPGRRTPRRGAAGASTAAPRRPGSATSCSGTPTTARRSPSRTARPT
jgi:UDP-2,3-diacylglucosamine pyrophosphatase LpxH